VELSNDMSESNGMTLKPAEIDDLDDAILDYFLEGREEGVPWGKATPSEIHRALDDRGDLDDLGNPVRQTIQNRVQRLCYADHLENVHGTGNYRFLSDPRDV